jgi:hypothetical protein
MRRGSKQHEDELRKTIASLEKEGYRVIDLCGYSPDAIAIKDGKIIAVEVLGKQWRKSPTGNAEQLHAGWTHSGKKKQYMMFDDLKIVTFVRSGEGFSDPELAKAVMATLAQCPTGILRANDIWKSLPCSFSQRRVRQILQELEKKQLVQSELRCDGRQGRYRLWKLVDMKLSKAPIFPLEKIEDRR